MLPTTTTKTPIPHILLPRSALWRFTHYTRSYLQINNDEGRKTIRVRSDRSSRQRREYFDAFFARRSAVKGAVSQQEGSGRKGGFLMLGRGKGVKVKRPRFRTTFPSPPAHHSPAASFLDTIQARRKQKIGRVKDQKVHKAKGDREGGGVDASCRKTADGRY